MHLESTFAQRLIDWQTHAGRHDLPWQNTRDPYRIWLSEIMLQQTQVSTVIPYYTRFLGRFPDVAALAAAPLESVIEHWAGLGYYARARNLHRCAQTIVAVHGGFFPKTAAELADLPGIGRSTAAAIAAFAYGERAAILDGNVKRVLCRVFGISGFPGQTAVDRTLWALAERLLPTTQIERYTQGLMDLGATRCTRHKPGCMACPFHDDCAARQTGQQAQLPSPRPKVARPKRQSIFLLLLDGDRLLLVRRPPEGLWGGLLVPPEGEPGSVLSALDVVSTDSFPLAPLKHAFTHFELTLMPLVCQVPGASARCWPADHVWLGLEEAAQAGVPKPIRSLIERLQQQRTLN